MEKLLAFYTWVNSEMRHMVQSNMVYHPNATKLLYYLRRQLTRSERDSKMVSKLPKPRFRLLMNEKDWLGLLEKGKEPPVIEFVNRAVFQAEQSK